MKYIIHAKNLTFAPSYNDTLIFINKIGETNYGKGNNK